MSVTATANFEHFCKSAPANEEDGATPVKALVYVAHQLTE